MPPRRSEQCTYKEKGRRCRKNGSGNPPLCRPHFIVMMEAARGATEHQHRAAGASILDDFLSGRIDLGDAFSAVVDEIINGVGGAAGPPRSSPFIPPFGPFNFNNPPAPGFRPQPRAPPVDPRIAELRARQVTARKVLGFPPFPAVISEEEIGRRRKELARKYHPDRPGGSLEKMKRVNAAIDILLTTV